MENAVSRAEANNLPVMMTETSMRLLEIQFKDTAEILLFGSVSKMNPEVEVGIRRKSTVMKARMAVNKLPV